MGDTIQGEMDKTKEKPRNASDRGREAGVVMPPLGVKG